MAVIVFSSNLIADPFGIKTRLWTKAFFLDISYEALSSSTSVRKSQTATALFCQLVGQAFEAADELEHEPRKIDKVFIGL